MKPVLLIFILILFAPTTAWTQDKTTVALLDLQIGEGLPQSSAPILSNLIRTEFVKSLQYNILDRGNMDAILKEQDFVLSDACNSKECAIQVGQLLGVQKMVFGSLGTLGKKILINLQMVDVATGKIEHIEGGSHVGAIEDLDAAVVRTARKLIGEKVEESKEANYAVYISSEPEGATIYVDDEMRGTTPTTLVFSNDHKVRLYVKAENYQDWYQEIQPKKGERVIVNAKLLATQGGGSRGSSSNEEYRLRTELYDLKKKSGYKAFGFSVFTGFFGGGHFYARSYLRGSLVCLCTVAGISALANETKNNSPHTTSLTLIYGGYFFDIIGSQFAVKGYNEQLRRELKLSAAPLPDGAIVHVSFDF